MKKLGILISLMLLISICKGQPDTTNHSKMIKAQADRMAELFLNKEYGSFIEFTCPAIIEMMGGKQKMLESLELGMKKTAADGMEVLNFIMGQPSKVVTSGNELQCTITQTIEMKMPKGRMVTNSTLIGVSSDKGKSWTFFDSRGKDIQTLQKMIPNLSVQLVIPEEQQPLFYDK